MPEYENNKERTREPMSANEVRYYKSPAAILLMDERQQNWTSADEDTKYFYLMKAKTQAEENRGRMNPR